MIDGQTLAETALDQIGLMADDIFDAHEELRERVEGHEPGRPGAVVRRTAWGVPALIYRFKDGSALSLAEHTDYYGNIHLVGADTFAPSEEKAPLSVESEGKRTTPLSDAPQIFNTRYEADHAQWRTAERSTVEEYGEGWAVAILDTGGEIVGWV